MPLEGPQLTIDDAKLAKLFEDQKLENHGEVLSYDPFVFNTHDLAELLRAAQDAGAIRSSSVLPVELVMYGMDDEDDQGYILAVRPRRPVHWLPFWIQVATIYSGTGAFFDRDEDGLLVINENSLRGAIKDLVADANALVGVLWRLARNADVIHEESTRA